MLAHVLWRQAADDVHVATLHGEFAGFIALGGDRFVAHDPLGRRISAAATLADARDAVGAVHVSAAPRAQALRAGTHPSRRQRRRDASDRTHPLDSRHA